MKYSSEFKCLKEKCPNTCCKGEIKLSLIDALKLSELGINNYKWFIDSRTNNPYAIMNNKQNNECPLLINGLCRIYDKEVRIKELINNDLSINARPLICRVYPEIIFYPETLTLELNSGCPGVSKWEYVDNKELVRKANHELMILKKLTMNLKRNNTKALARLLLSNKLSDEIKKELTMISYLK